MPSGEQLVCRTRPTNVPILIDSLDAHVLSKYGSMFSSLDRGEVEEVAGREELRQLMSRRRQLVVRRVREHNRLDKGVSESVAKSSSQHILWLEQEIQQLDMEKAYWQSAL